MSIALRIYAFNNNFQTQNNLFSKSVDLLHYKPITQYIIKKIALILTLMQSTWYFYWQNAVL